MTNVNPVQIAKIFFVLFFGCLWNDGQHRVGGRTSHGAIAARAQDFRCEGQSPHQTPQGKHDVEWPRYHTSHNERTRELSNNGSLAKVLTPGASCLVRHEPNASWLCAFT